VSAADHLPPPSSSCFASQLPILQEYAAQLVSDRFQEDKVFGSNIVDMTIGLVLVFLIVSLICSALREIVETVLKQRALDLERGIRELLCDPTGEALARELYSHPLVYSLYQGVYEPRTTAKSFWHRWFSSGGNLPSYIPSSSFARALIDLDQQGKVQSPAIATLLRSLSQDTAGDVAQLRANLEAWFDASTQRISGWYKRRTQAILFALGLGTAAILNVNAFVIADELFHQSELRSAVTASAESLAASPAAASGTGARVGYESSLTELHKLAAAGLPMGWRGGPASAAPLYVLLLGWVITAIAVTLGAPFWFDLLNKFMVLRSTIKPNTKPIEQEPKAAMADGRTGVTAVGSAERYVLSVPVVARDTAAAQPELVTAGFQPHEWASSEEEGVL
jgi:hypothetical protein